MSRLISQPAAGPRPRPIRVNRTDLSDPQLRELHTWLAALGVIPEQLAPCVTILPPARGRSWELHLSAAYIDAAGAVLMDHNLRRLAYHPIVIAVPHGSWPTWMARFAAAE